MSADPTTFRWGGFRELVFYTPAGDVHSVKARISGGSGGAGAHPVREVMEYFQGGDGTKAELRAKWSYEPTLVSEADLRVLRSWRADGKRIGVICLGDTPASWREPVPVLLTDDGGGRGAFAGQKVVMETRRLEADVQRGPDFFAGVDLSGGAEVALPVAGMLLRIEAATGGATIDVEARAYDGSVLQSATAAPVVFMELPEGTFYLYVSGASRASLESPAYSLAAAARWIVEQQRIIDVTDQHRVELSVDDEALLDYDPSRATGEETVAGGAVPDDSYVLTEVTPLRLDDPYPVPTGYEGLIKGHLEDSAGVTLTDEGAATPITIDDPVPVKETWGRPLKGFLRTDAGLPELEQRSLATKVVVDSYTPTAGEKVTRSGSPLYIPYDFEGQIKGHLEGVTHVADRYKVELYFLNAYRGSEAYAYQEYVYADANGDFTIQADPALASGYDDDVGSGRPAFRVYDDTAGAHTPDVPSRVFWGADTERKYLTQYWVEGYNITDKTYRHTEMDGPVLYNRDVQAWGANAHGRRQLRLVHRDDGTEVGGYWTNRVNEKSISPYEVRFSHYISEEYEQPSLTVRLFTDGTWATYQDNSSDNAVEWWVYLYEAGTDTQAVKPFKGETHLYEELEIILETWQGLIYTEGPQTVGIDERYSFGGMSSGEGPIVVKARQTRDLQVVGQLSGRGVLPRSYTLKEGDSNKGTRFESRVYSYGAAEALLVATGRGEERRAHRYAQGVLQMQNTGQYTGKDIDATASFGSFCWYTDHFRPKNWWAYYDNMVFRLATDGWCVYALGKYLKRYPNSPHKEEVTRAIYRALGRMERHRHQTGHPYYGGVKFGWNEWGGPPDYEWIEEENPNVGWEAHIEVWHSMNLCYEIYGDERFRAVRDRAKTTILEGLWHDGEEDRPDDEHGGAWHINGFYIGINVDNSWHPDSWSAISDNDHANLNRTGDHWWWGGVFLEAVGEDAKLEKMQKTLYHWESTTPSAQATGQEVNGYRAHSPFGGYSGALDTVWYEGSFGAALYFWRIGQTEDYEALIDELRKGQFTSGPHEGAFPYQERPDEQYQLSDNPSLSSTAWSIFATELRDFLWSEKEVNTPSVIMSPLPEQPNLTVSQDADSITLTW
jgi:hypothetical protein